VPASTFFAEKSPNLKKSGDKPNVVLLTFHYRLRRVVAVPAVYAGKDLFFEKSAWAVPHKGSRIYLRRLKSGSS
jgi:hypothetical protein